MEDKGQGKEWNMGKCHTECPWWWWVELWACVSFNPLLFNSL